MFAHMITGFTGPDDVLWTEVAEPAAGGGVVIDVVAAGVSFADLLQTMGAYQMKVPVPYTPGMDAAGVVRSARPGLGLAPGHHAVLSRGWLAAVRGLVGERAVDIVVDPVGGDRMTDSLRILAPEGRLLVLGFSAGEIPVVKVNRLLLGNTGVLGVASREFFEQQPATVAELWAQLIELRRTGVLHDPPVQPYPFADARGALRAIAQRKATGKVVLSRQVPGFANTR